jgi:hypothetical protein
MNDEPNKPSNRSLAGGIREISRGRESEVRLL